MDSSSLSILFVINPSAGVKKKFDWETVIRNYFKNLPHTIEFYILKGKDDTGSINYKLGGLLPLAEMVQLTYSPNACLAPI